MKYIFTVLLLLSLLFLPAQIDADSHQSIDIHYFMDEFCTNCDEVSKFLDEHYLDDQNIHIIEYDILDDQHFQLYSQTLEVFDANQTIPMIVIGGTVLQGAYEIQSYLPDLIDYYQGLSTYEDVVFKLIDNEEITDEDIIPNPVERTIDLPIIGEINLNTFSLFLGAIFIGMIDGFNPCAMWVLVFLITMLINLKNRKRIWILGLTFILTSGLVYFIIMMSWLQIVVNFIWLRSFQIAIGLLALVFAFFSIKHYWRQHKIDTGCDVTSIKQRNKLMQRIKKVITEKHIIWAIIGIVGVALSVNVIELACSAGLPVVYTSMLAYQNVGEISSVFYILTYVFFFMLDDFLIFAIAVITLKVTGISSKYAKYSNLIGGLIMLFIGLSLMFFPNLLF